MKLDRGLQPERTDLAWRRTLLAVIVGTLVSTRVLPPVLGPWAFALSLGGVVAGALLWVGALGRARAINDALAGSRRGLPGGGLLAALGSLVVIGAGTGLVWVLARALG